MKLSIENRIITVNGIKYALPYKVYARLRRDGITVFCGQVNGRSLHRHYNVRNEKSFDEFYIEVLGEFKEYMGGVLYKPNYIKQNKHKKQKFYDGTPVPNGVRILNYKYKTDTYKYISIFNPNNGEVIWIGKANDCDNVDLAIELVESAWKEYNESMTFKLEDRFVN